MSFDDRTPHARSPRQRGSPPSREELRPDLADDPSAAPVTPPRRRGNGDDVDAEGRRYWEDDADRDEETGLWGDECDDEEAGEEDIGYRRPPRRTRFQPNQPSPNPHGRPPGIPNPGWLTRRMNRMIAVNSPSGQSVRMSQLEALLQQIAQAAAKGDRYMRKLRDERIAKETRHAAEAARLEEEERNKPPVSKTAERLEVQIRLYDWLYRLIEPYTTILKQLEKLGVITGTDHRVTVHPWMLELVAGRRHRER